MATIKYIDKDGVAKVEKELLEKDKTYTPFAKYIRDGMSDKLVIKDVYKRVVSARIKDIEKELDRRRVAVYDGKDIKELSDEELMEALQQLEHLEYIFDDRLRQQDTYWKED